MANFGERSKRGGARSRVATFALLFVVSSAAFAQGPQRGPRIGYVYPAGGQRGSAFEVSVGGQFLDGARAAVFSGRGIEASVLEHKKPPSPQQLAAWRERVKQLVEKRASAFGKGKQAQPASWSEEEERELKELRARLQAFQGRPPNPTISETVRLEVRVAPDADLGERELRLLAGGGLTNPLEFRIGALREFREEDSEAISLPCVANGQILPGDVDRFRFSARRGQRLIFAVEARSLIPYLADAVPGWFQATLAVFDPKGREIAYVDDYRFDPDPVLFLEVPEDGDYAIEIEDALFRGREDFVYRVSGGELPFIESVFPLGATIGAKAALEVRGRNLPAERLELETQGREPHFASIRLFSDGLPSNCVRFEWCALPSLAEPGEREGAREIEIPAVLDGRIEAPGDRDEFWFRGRAGEEIVAEVRARRLGSPLDSLLRLLDSEGKEIAANDDWEDPGAGLVTHHADSYLRAKLPSDGTYRIEIADAQGAGGPHYGYRLRVGPPRPDYELRIFPSGVNVRAGGRASLRAVAVRRDGFSGEIRLELEGAPRGLALEGARIPAGEESAQFRLATGPRAPRGVFPLAIVGRAEIDGREVIRRAVPAEERTQAFAYRHLVPARELLVFVRDVPVAPKPRPK